MIHVATLFYSTALSLKKECRSCGLLHIAAKELNCLGIYESIIDYEMHEAKVTGLKKTGKELKNLIGRPVIEQRMEGLRLLVRIILKRTLRNLALKI